MNVTACPSTPPSACLKNFGFQSGRTADKFAGWDTVRSDNGW